MSSFRIRSTNLPLVSAAAWALFALSLTSPASADNPIVQHVYTADPAPMVSGDTMYLYTSHDEDVTLDNFFTMNDWRLFSTKDAVNWTDHGSPLGYKSFTWATGKAWAPQCVERNGKFYLYVPVSNSIGVAVADSPYGPFKDALGKPLLSNYQYIDPTVFIDTDGQAYLYFGNPKLWYVKLNQDMISYSGSVQQIANTTQSFGQRNGDADRPTLYEEGPWFYRRDALYYMIFAAGPLPEDINYSTSPGPTGPWTYRGTIMDNTTGHAFTNHSGAVDFKGHSFFFYHNQKLAGGGGYKRSVAVEEFTYNADGSIPKIVPTNQGPKAVENLNPFERVEGETMAWSQGIEVDGASTTERYLSFLDNGDYVKLSSVDFGTGALSFSATVATAGNGGKIELHLNASNGPTIGTCNVTGTGGWQTWQAVSCDVDVAQAQGVHDLFLVFTGTGSSLFNLDFWQFEPKDPPVVEPGSGGSSGIGGTGGDGVGGSSATGGTFAGTGGTVTGVGGTGVVGSGGTAAGVGGGVVGTGGDFADQSDVDDDEAAGCACSTGPRPIRQHFGWLVGAMFALVAARRRTGERNRSVI